MTPSLAKRPLLNRYFSILIEAAAVSTWALWQFRDRTTDEIAASALVVMLVIIGFGEILFRLGPKVSPSIFKQGQRSDQPRRRTASLPLSVRIASISTASLIVAFLVAASYGLVFLTSAPVFRASGLDWATRPTLLTGLYLIAAGLAALFLGAIILGVAIGLSIVSSAEAAIRLWRKTGKALSYLIQLHGFEVRSSTGMYMRSPSQRARELRAAAG